MSGNSQEASEHRLNASQTIKELTSGKKMSEELDIVTKKSSSWVETVEKSDLVSKVKKGGMRGSS